MVTSKSPRTVHPKPAAESQDRPAPLISLRGVSASLGGEVVLRDLDLDVLPLRASRVGLGVESNPGCSQCGWCEQEVTGQPPARPGRLPGARPVPGERPLGGCGRGPVIGLLGPSGIGKTTLLRILAGLLPPDGGTASLDADDCGPSRCRMGLVAQHSPLFRHRTVLGNLLVAGAQAGQSGDESRRLAMDLLERLDVAEHADKYPAQLSGGQRQRVAIAQQFMCCRNFLLLDEPFSGLDCVTLRSVIDLLRDIMRKQDLRAIILVTHDVDAALESCDRLLLLGHDSPSDRGTLPGARIQQDFDLRALGIGPARYDPAAQQVMLDVRHAVCEAFKAL